MEKRRVLQSNLIVAIAAICRTGAAVCLGLQYFPRTGDALVGERQKTVGRAVLIGDGRNQYQHLNRRQRWLRYASGGRRGSAGDVIAIMDSDTLLAKKQQAQASIKAYQGQLKAAQATYQKALNGASEETPGPSQGRLRFGRSHLSAHAGHAGGGSHQPVRF